MTLLSYCAKMAIRDEKIEDMFNNHHGRRKTTQQVKAAGQLTAAARCGERAVRCGVLL